MNYLLPFSEFGLYLLFSTLVGHIVLQFVPDLKKPTNKLPKSVLLLCTLGIIVFTFIPLLQLIFLFKESVGIKTAALSVLTDFQIGRAWIAISVLSLLLWIMIYLESDKLYQSLCVLLMILAVGSASHVASLSFLPGIYSHSIHFLMVTGWVGVLLHVSWFSKDQSNWLSFLRWFTPFASICLLVILISGFILMYFVVEPKQYINSWAVPYGRMLLIKHISIVPVIVFAFINGMLTKKSATLSNFDPRPWVKGESIILMLVFFSTAVMGMLSPPHEIDLVSKSVTKPTWIEWLLVNQKLAITHIGFSPSIPSILLIILSLLFLFLIIASFRKVNAVIAILLGVGFIITIYLGLMFSVVLYN